MGRYENTKLKSSIGLRGIKEKKLYISTANATTLYSAVPSSDSDIHVITQMGDRLDQLAHQFYGDVNLWWYIAKANHLTFMTLPTGTSLRIPASTIYAIGT